MGEDCSEQGEHGADDKDRGEKNCNLLYGPQQFANVHEQAVRDLIIRERTIRKRDNLPIIVLGVYCHRWSFLLR